MSILEMSLTASAIILFAMILRRFALDRLPKRTFVALWLLAAARMLIPVEIPFRFSAGTLVRRAAEPAIRTAAPTAATAVQQMPVPVIVQSAEVPIWRIIWLAGLTVCALALTIPHLRWRRVYARSLPAANGSIAELPRRVRVRISDEIPSPLTYGLFRPTILLPAHLNPSNTAYVLEHELTHIRHLDALWKLVFAAALCAHWFNPLAWIMYLLANRDIELACDESVLRRFGDAARQNYARTLVDLAARQSGLPSPLFNSFSRQTIEERIQAIMKMKKLTKIAALAAVLLVAFSALAFATTAQNAESHAELDELMFNGYEKQSVREYRAWLDSLGVEYDMFELSHDLWQDRRYVDFMLYVLEPLTYPEWDAEGGWTRETAFGVENVDTGEAIHASIRAECKVLDEDQLTVGKLRDALKAILEVSDDFDLIGSTQEQLDAQALELEETWSDGSTIAFQVMIELSARESPYTDSDALALLDQYAALGLEYEYNFGELTMRYRGIDVKGVWDPVQQAITANSTGPKGLAGGPILEVVYEDGTPVGLRFTE